MKLTLSVAKQKKGGAIYAEDSSVIYGGFTTVTLANNTAQVSGGGLFLLDSHLFIIVGKHLIFYHDTAADKGGALYVLENKCEEVSNLTSCFIDFNIHQINVHTLTFLNNDARHGSILYGGFLDRCHTDFQLGGLEWFTHDIRSDYSMLMCRRHPTLWHK